MGYREELNIYWKVKLKNSEIISSWMEKAVETIQNDNKICKDHLRIYFKSVSGVMSTQLRKMVFSTFQNLLKYIINFKKKQY